MKPNYIIIPLIVLVTAILGGAITSYGMNHPIGWYEMINKPAWTPAGSVIGTVWTILFILIAISVLIFWNGSASPRQGGAGHRQGDPSSPQLSFSERDSRFKLATIVFVLNAILNVLWSYVFFVKHFFSLAIYDAGALGLTVILLIFLIRPYSRKAAVLLMPYAIWVAFATYLTYAIYILNPIISN